ncbi:MAG: flagellar basal body-associated protein FliL [Pseudodesulfovibrio sp.]|jgi:flagellar FliL protein|uniref:Flagellar protein FliL n=1 Tax=Pseudodesulfovibrio indicus TaxID=1716143 RepID=A0A140D920_9BACT|nr:flagellar basal body-associated FliL family protein [Pseudodesulfovibrio indicus]AMK09687.1 flagellar basal body protein FliL [Pseudodesulfovibrio indicus]TDT86357.1 flagellar FliL protein [Pseudodesulfovibrio indicus]
MAQDELTQEEGKKKGGLLKWIIIAVVLIALGVGGWFGYKMFFAAPPEDAAATQDAGGDAGKPAESLEGQLVPLPTFLVNLADPLGRRYLKLGVEVEVRDEEAQAALAKYEAKIKDTLLLLLSSKSYDGLSTMQAKVELKQEIADRLNQIIGNGGVLRVYITEMVIQ